MESKTEVALGGTCISFSFAYGFFSLISGEYCNTTGALRGKGGRNNRDKGARCGSTEAALGRQNGCMGEARGRDRVFSRGVVSFLYVYFYFYIIGECIVGGGKEDKKGPVTFLSMFWFVVLLLFFFWFVLSNSMACRESEK